MAAVTGILEATTTLDTLFGRFETAVKKIYERGDVVEDNRIQLQRVQRKFRNIAQLLPQARSSVANNAHARVSLREMEDALQVEFVRVVGMEEDVTSATIVNRVKRMMQIMNKCEALEDKLLDFLGEKVFPIVPSNSSSDEYVPASNIPPNPPRLTLDYSTCETDEGKLKATILEQRDARVIAFIASGQGGVGKTCALHGLADEGEIVTRFTGGRLYISLGNDAKQADVIRGLAEIVGRTGGKQLSEQIKTQETVKEACRMAGCWFERQTCLFLVDDVWNLHGIDSNTILSLGDIVHGNSRMVYTSRDQYFRDSAEKVIEFKAKSPDGLIARKMLLRHAGFSENDYQLLSEEAASAISAILQECQGLPLALGIVGGAILKMSGEYDVNNKTDVWVDYRKDMKKCSTMYDVAKRSEKHAKLRRIVDLSLDVLRRRDPGIDVSYLFRSLCVLQKQQSVPTSVLQRLWNLDNLDEADTIVSAFRDVSLVQVSRQQGTRFVKLHDLVLDLAKQEAGRVGETHRFYVDLIKNYSREGDNIPGDSSRETSAVVIDSVIDDVEQEKRERHIKWWHITADGYIHENICKLLHGGEKINELLWLLSRPEWITYRALNGGVLQVKADVNEGIAALGQSESSFKHREHLEIIGNAIRLSSSYIYRNPSEVWFQLYGRLQWHATVNDLTERFIGSIESAAPRPWVKAPIGVLQQANLHSRAILEIKHKCLCIRVEKGVIRHLWWSAVGEEIGITSCDVNAEKEHSLILDTTYFKENRCFHFDFIPVFRAAFSGDGLNVVVVHKSLRIGVFKTETGKLEKCHRLENRSYLPKRNTFRCCFPSSQEQKRVIGISKDGKYVATSNDEHDVRIWNAVTGETIGPTLRGHTSRVNCMVIDAYGKLIVTGGDNGTIRVWDVRSGEAVGSSLRGHTGRVTCLIMGADNSQVVSCAADTSVRTWDIWNGRTLGNPSLSHEEEVLCVSMSEDGSKIVSGSRDGAVIVWYIQDGIMKGHPLRGHTNRIECVGISSDGGIAASISFDGTLRVWNTTRSEGMEQGAVENQKKYRGGQMSADRRRYVFKTGKRTAEVVDTISGEAVGSPIQIDIESLKCVGISADDERCVFGFHDGTLIVFDTKSGEQIGEPLRGHEGAIRCLLVSADGNVIVSASRDKTLLWDTDSGTYVGKPLVGHSGVLRCVALSADGSRIVSGSRDTTICVWDARSGEAIGGPFRGHTNQITCVGMSADGTKAASGSWDGTVRVWDVDSSQHIAGPFRHDSLLLSLGFDANMSKIVTICINGTPTLWNVESGSSVSTVSSQGWLSELNHLSLSWNGHVARKNIIYFDENGTETVLATTDVVVYNGPGGDIYFTKHADPLILLR